MKKAIVIISYGTSLVDARQNIFDIENIMISSMVGYDFFRVFGSRFIVNKIKFNEGILMKSLIETIEELIENKYEEVVFQPTYIINGYEFEKIKQDIERYKSKFRIVKIGSPLLTSLEDFRNTFNVINGNVNIKNNDGAVVFLGHGTEHFSNSAYSQMENYFMYNGIENVFVGTLKAFPKIEDIINILKNRNIKKVTLIPFMIVCGEHTMSDMFGDSPNSWKNILKNNDISVNVNRQCLGEMNGIQNIFLNHALNAKEIKF